MSRLFRLLEKKRGERRTGSNLVGSVGEALLYGAMFLLGVTALSTLIAVHVWQPQSAWYTVGVGFWLMIVVLSSFVVTGGVGLIWTVVRLGISAERRSAFATHAGALDLVHQTAPRSKDHPTVPAFDGLTDSPGTELAYRLPTSQSPGWRLLAKTIFALLWNGIACVLFVVATKSWLEGAPQWFLTCFLVPYLGVSGWSIYYLFQQIWIHTGLGQTAVEISDHPLYPGREYQVHLSQAGHIDIKSIELWLVCEEEVTYRQGTDIRHELRTVFQQQLMTQGPVEIEPSQPFRASCTLPIPDAAMHSFQSEHNAVRWKILVRCAPAHWPEFERRHPIIVFPGEATLRAVVTPALTGPATRGQRSPVFASIEVVA
ncbi:MAG: hypothetical protein ACKVP0_06645 [Pirellulaceae bacterium]